MDNNRDYPKGLSDNQNHSLNCGTVLRSNLYYEKKKCFFFLSVKVLPENILSTFFYFTWLQPSGGENKPNVKGQYIRGRGEALKEGFVGVFFFLQSLHHLV